MASFFMGFTKAMGGKQGGEVGDPSIRCAHLLVSSFSFRERVLRGSRSHGLLVVRFSFAISPLIRRWRSDV